MERGRGEMLRWRAQQGEHWWHRAPLLRPRVRLAALACLTSACLSLTAVAAPARADEPAAITVTTASGMAFGAAFLPVLSFGTPLSIQATSTSGQPVTISAEGGCSAAGQAAPQSAAVLTVVSSTQACLLTVASGAGNGLAEASASYVLRTRMGPQTAPVALVGRKVRPGTSVDIGPAGMTTDRGQQVIVTVANGSKFCTVKTRKGAIRVAFGEREGACTVSARAAGVPEQFEPFQRIYVFSIRRKGHAGLAGAGGDSESSVTSATMAR